MKNKIIVAITGIAISILMAANVEAGVIRSEGGVDRDYVPTGKGWGVPDLGKQGGQKGDAVIDVFGGGQAVAREADGTLVGASDRRKDGCALGWWA